MASFNNLNTAIGGIRWIYGKGDREMINSLEVAVPSPIDVRLETA